MEGFGVTVARMQALCRRCVEFHAECLCYFQDRRETRVSFGTESTVETLTAQPRIFCDLGHSLGARDVSKRSGDTCCVVWSLFEPSIKVSGHFFGRTEMLGHIVRGGLGFRRLLLGGCLGRGGLLLEVFRQLDSCCNVRLLRRLVTAGEQ